ncbi:DUF305 domain-containing protein [Bordetella sputigena]|uniref:hypothetical protein n=1 Tax=Bordetella sputigena TaxID=1416810 RepID=UPI0039F09D09
MHTKRLVAMSLLAAAMAAAGPSAVADTNTPPGPPGMGWRHPMMGEGPMGRQFMGGPGMQGCPMAAMGMAALPPGNEKIAMQMHGEMMKAMGEILLKYADKLEMAPAPSPSPAPAR